MLGMPEMQMAAFALETAVGTVERGPGTLLMPVAGGLIAALAISAFFMRHAAKKGEWDRKHDPNKFKHLKK